MDPSRPGALAVVVGPGRTAVTVRAAFPVLVVGGVRVPNLEGDFDTEGDVRAAEARDHDLVAESRGGQLVVAVTGDCAEASVTITGSR